MALAQPPQFGWHTISSTIIFLFYDLCNVFMLIQVNSQDEHVALKVFIRSQALGDHVKYELSMYKRIEQCPSDYEGRNAIRALLDSFQIEGPDGDHLVLAHPPLGDSLEVGLSCTSPRRLPPAGLRYVLKDLFLELHYLHVECRIIHTGDPIFLDFFLTKDQSC